MFFATRIRFFLGVVMVLCCVALCVLRVSIFLQNEAAQTLPHFIGKSVMVVGRVSDDPDKRETSLHLTIEVQTVGSSSVSGGLLALVPRESHVLYGDVVTMRGVLEAPKAFETGTGHTFDYPNYLRVRGISTEMSRATLVKSTSTSASLQGALFWLKHTFEASLDRLFAEPQNALLQGILLGERRGIPKDMIQKFVDSGLVHVVVLSGYNISIVSEGVFRALSFLPRTAGFISGGFTMILFALLVGGGATTLRALIMAGIALLARYMHRSAIALRSLAVAAVGMALWNPLIVLYDPSFILSVGATFGLITLSPWVESRLSRLKLFSNQRFLGARSIAASTIAVEIFILPALLYFSGVLSLLSVPANVLALPVVPAAMLLGFLAGLLGLISPLLGFIPMLGADALLRWMLLVTTTAASIPFGVAVIPQFSGWIVLACYIPLTWFAILKYQKTALLTPSNSDF